ncbi:DUF979 domain-containing protein [Streptomyces sp. NPDC057740]|uniref:DUF979 domain-containing protein n=1 Tax=Streptomyces sp. NPDC057740 TaxID=3346234 RepID=UPI0036771130
MIKIEWFFWLLGLITVVNAGQMAVDRSNPKRLTSAAFWGLLGVSFWYGTGVAAGSLPAEPLGAAVLAMIGLVGFNLLAGGVPRTTGSEERVASAARLGKKLFLPALVIPAVAIVCATVLKGVTIGGTPLLEPKSETLIGLVLGCVAALVVAMLVTGEKKLSVPLHSGRSLMEVMGAALLLPQLLAVLGSLFAAAGVGEQVGRITNAILPEGQRLVAVVAYCLGMALFTIVMGNAFAAFPVMTAAVGWPVLVEQMNGNPAAVLAIGMLAGFCGTLCTPMAANFNVVPATLLELKDQYGVIKAQIPTAGTLLGCNIVIMSAFAF